MNSNRLQSWLRQIFNPAQKQYKTARRRFRPRLEALEDRSLLAVFLVTSNLNDGAGTLHAAILSANANPGADTIEFDLSAGNLNIVLNSPLPTLADAVTIDGTSQPGWISSPLIIVNGTVVGVVCNGLTATADGCRIKGLDVEAFRGGGAAIALYSNNNIVSGNLIRFNTVGVEIANATSGNVIGGTTARGRNVISENGTGVDVHENSTGNVVEGNYIGTTADGLNAFANANGIKIDEGASNNLVGGTARGAGNLISGNTNGFGVLIGLDATGNLVQGNKIGTDVTGTAALANFDGVDIEGSNNTVGGTAAGAGNLISGNSNDGIFIEGSGASNQVLGNRIGTNVTGTNALPNSFEGVFITGNNNTVGGTAVGAGNIIAFNRFDGVLVQSGTGNAIRRNSIFANALPGIEQFTGANNNQAAPTMTSATFNAATRVMTIHGTLTSTASTHFTLEFFANAIPVSPLVAQGAVYLGSFVVTTNAAGTIAFTATVTIPATTPFSSVTTPMITATATDPTGNTSQFSNAVHDPIEPAKKPAPKPVPQAQLPALPAKRRGF